MTEQTIFLTALDIPDPAGRTAYLDRACAGDPTLRRQVEALLAAHEKSGLFLDEPVLEQAAGLNARTVSADEPPGPDTPTRISPDSARTGGDDLGFLRPPTRPGVLGRLAHYEVLEVLGRGGFGTVLRVFDDRLHRVVAIKVLSPQLATSGTARARFQREARAGAAVRDEHVVSIHEVSRDDEPVPYLVMEYVAGQTLQQKLDRTGPLSVREILRIGSQVARGLAAAHATGLIHRDIKPSNVLLENGVERVKITDFGLARAADDASISQTGVIAGTPQYMAPEQAQGSPIDHRSDLFSLGSVLYAMCTGRPPFRATTTMAVLKRVCEEDPRPIREINPEVPDWLCAVIAKLHAKRREDRFQSAREVADLLQQHLAHLQQPDRAPMPAPVAVPAPPAAGVWRSAVWSPDMFWTVAALVVAAGALIVYIQWRYGDLPAQWRADLGVAAGLGFLLWLYARRVWRPGPAPRPRLLRPAWAAGAGASVLLFLALAYYQDGALRLFLRNEAKVALVDAEHVAVEVTVLQGGAVVYDRSADREFVLDADAPAEVRVFKAPAGVELFRKEVPLRAGMTTQVSVARELADAEERNRAGAGDQVARIGQAVQEFADAGWVSLFNGRDLTGWRPHPDQPGGWKVEDGILVGGGRKSHLFTERGDYQDFRLRFEAKVNAGGDSGVFLRTPFSLKAGWDGPQGYEAQVATWTGTLVFEGQFFGRSAGVPPDTWFTGEVIATGSRIVVKVNGETTAEFTDPRGTHSKGHLALQAWHPQTVVHFRKVEIQELPPMPSPATDAAKLQGDWKLIGGEIEGWKLPDPFISSHLNLTMSFSGDQAHVRWVPPKENVAALEAMKMPWKSLERKGVFHLDEQANPKRLSVFVPNNNKDSLFGIYRLEPDRLTLCFAHNPREIKYPTEFATRKGDGLLLLAFERVRRTEGTEGFIPLFNGKDLAGWKAHPDHPGPWSVKDGILRGAGATGHLMSVAAYGDFHLRAVTRINDGGVGGVLFRADEADSPAKVPRAYQAKINANTDAILRTGSLYWSDSLYVVGKDPLIKPGEWFTCEVIARGYRIQLKVNGQTTLDWTDGNQRRARGHLALHLSNDKTEVEFQSIEVKELPADPKAGPPAKK